MQAISLTAPLCEPSFKNQMHEQHQSTNSTTPAHHPHMHQYHNCILRLPASSQKPYCLPASSTRGFHKAISSRQLHHRHPSGLSTASAAAMSGPLDGATAGAFGRLGRPALITDQVKAAYADLVDVWPSSNQLPVVYHPKYNITFFGIEKLHPFDACKFSKVLASLKTRKLLTQQQVVTPKQASRAALEDVHTKQYLDELHTTTYRVVQVTEMAALSILPTFLLQWKVVTPMRYHVGGTMLAAALALERGWALNLGGGMHHASHDQGGGWCPFDDITLAIRQLRKATGLKLKVLYIDLDVHQGNGVERDKLHFADADLAVLDVYHQGIYPNDDTAMPAIDIDVPLKKGTDDATYLTALSGALQTAAQRFPDLDLVFYNAGTDILDGDPLGRFRVSSIGVQERDRMVWDWALNTAKAPIIMTLSGGYAPNNAAVVSESLAALFQHFNLTV